MNPALLLLTQIALAACGFLLYFLYALRRESRKSLKEFRVEIRPIAKEPSKENVVPLHAISSSLGKFSSRRNFRSASGR